MGHRKAAVYLHSREVPDLLTTCDSETGNFRFYTDNFL